MKQNVCGSGFFLLFLAALGGSSAFATPTDGGNADDANPRRFPVVSNQAIIDKLPLQQALQVASQVPSFKGYGFDILSNEIDQFYTDVAKEEKKREAESKIFFRDGLVQNLVDTLADHETPILIGGEGVGKEAIVQRLTQVILNLDVPARDVFDNLHHVDVVGMEAMTLVRLMKSHGINPLVAMNAIPHFLNRDVILYISNVHEIGAEGLQLINGFLKSPNRKLRLILGADPEQLNALVRQDPRLLKRMTPFPVDDLKPEEVEQIISDHWITQLLRKYRVVVSDRALTLATRYAKKAFPKRSTFDGAYKLLSEASIALNREMSGELGAIELDETALMNYLRVKLNIQVNPADPEAMDRYEKELKASLKSRVKGQDDMVDGLVETWMDMQDATNRRGVRVLTFMGPTGVGKSLLAKEFAAKAFDSPKAVLEIACSEYKDKASLDALLGFPPNYQGATKTSGILNDWLDDATRGKNGGLIILNEIEKAAPEFMQIIMEILDTGRILGKDGVERHLGRHMIIFTTNRGSNLLFPKGYERWSQEELDRHLQKMTQERLKQLFKTKTSGEDKFNLPPEVLARIDRFILARPLTREIAGEILRLRAEEFAKLAHDQYGLELKIDESMIKYLIDAKFLPAEGARIVEKTLEFELKRALSAARLEFKPESGQELRFSVVTRDGKSFLVTEFHDQRREAELEIPGSMQAQLSNPAFIARMRNVNSKMKSMVIGQDLVIDTLSTAVTGFLSLGQPKRPLSIFLIGTTGTGKTEMARALSYALYDDANRVEVINFGNVLDRTALTNKFGSPSGYLGQEEIREFEQALMRNPDGGVLVLDELSNMGGENKAEKNSLFKQLYEIFEEGKWTSAATNTTYDLSKYVIINTGNDGEKLFQGIAADDLRMATWESERSQEKVISLLTESGVPEAFLGRMAGVFLMKPVLRTESQKITDKLIRESLAALKEELGVEIRYDEAFLIQFTKTFFSQTKGARSLRNIIENRMKGVVSQLIIEQGGLQQLEGRSIRVHLSDNLTERPYVKNGVPERKVTLNAELVSSKGQLISTKEFDVTYDAPERVKLTLEQAFLTAFHEAGHAVVNEPTLTGEKLKFITINPSGKYLGYARYDKPNRGVYAVSGTEKALLNWVARLYAGQRAQILAGFPQDTGWHSDRERANEIITKMLVENGMHPDLAGMERIDGKFVPSKAQQQIIDAEIKRYTEQGIRMADEALVAKWDLVRSVVAQIIRTGEIGEEQFDEILRNRQPEQASRWVIVRGQKEGEPDHMMRVGAPELEENWFAWLKNAVMRTLARLRASLGIAEKPAPVAAKVAKGLKAAKASPVVVDCEGAFLD